MSIEDNGEREKKKAETFPNSEEHPTHIPDFYRDKKKKKVLDFFLGFGLIISEFIVILKWNKNASEQDFGAGGIIFLIPITIIIIIVDISLVVRFSKNRRYIAVGMFITLMFSILFAIISFIIQRLSWIMK